MEFYAGQIKCIQNNGVWKPGENKNNKNNKK